MKISHSGLLGFRENCVSFLEGFSKSKGGEMLKLKTLNNLVAIF